MNLKGSFGCVAVSAASAILFLCPVGDRYIGIDQIANLDIVYDNEYNDEKKGIRGGQGSGSIIRLTHRSNLARR